jgi:maltooligosyltrehalose trehalohydrolase
MNLKRTEFGYHEGTFEGVQPGDRYVYCLNGKSGEKPDAKKERPDPASRYQPDGVHGPSQVIDFSLLPRLDEEWRGIPLEDYIVYEVHAGTYTHEGTFDAIIPHLDRIKKLGVTALELMPVAQFPGDRNWGYDGVYPFAVQNCYGGPEGLRRLVNACHARGLAVVLDVVYNHLGPEGNYLADFAPYFTDQYWTPWGQAINFDGPGSDEVVNFFIANALYWVRDFQIDALRLDAIHGIMDRNAQPFLKLLAAAVHAFAEMSGRKIHLIAESDLNDVRFIQLVESGGYGLDAQWSDDFHHSLHAVLTGERSGYYLDFGELDQVRKAWEEGFVYSGQFSPYRLQRHGNSSRDIPGQQLMVCMQNHDQVGNRMLGERLSALVSFETLKLAAALTILSPYLPLLFMGEEWGEQAPFQYFTSHSDANLITAVRRGRREEFAAFRWSGEPPDSQDKAVFERCKLDHSMAQTEQGRALWEFYREIIKLRRSAPALRRLSKSEMEVSCGENGKVLQIRRHFEEDEYLLLANFAEETMPVPKVVNGQWKVRLDSADRRWGGPGSAAMADIVPGGVMAGVAPTSIIAGVVPSGAVRRLLSPRSFIAFQRVE